METRQGREARSGRAGRAWIRREGREGGPYSRRLIGPIERGQGRGSKPERVGKAWSQGREGRPDLGELVGHGYGERGGRTPLERAGRA